MEHRSKKTMPPSDGQPVPRGTNRVPKNLQRGNGRHKSKRR